MSRLTKRRRRERIHATRRKAVVRSQVIRRDGGICYLCGEPVPPAEIRLDHVVPLAQGGKHVYKNLRVACRACNTLKGGLLLDEFFAKAPAYRKTIDSKVLATYSPTNKETIHVQG